MVLRIFGIDVTADDRPAEYGNDEYLNADRFPAAGGSPEPETHRPAIECEGVPIAPVRGRPSGSARADQAVAIPQTSRALHQSRRLAAVASREVRAGRRVQDRPPAPAPRRQPKHLRSRPSARLRHVAAAREYPAVRWPARHWLRRALRLLRRAIARSTRAGATLEGGWDRARERPSRFFVQCASGRRVSSHASKFGMSSAASDGGRCAEPRLHGYRCSRPSPARSRARPRCSRAPPVRSSPTGSRAPQPSSQAHPDRAAKSRDAVETPELPTPNAPGRSRRRRDRNGLWRADQTSLTCSTTTFGSSFSITPRLFDPTP